MFEIMNLSWAKRRPMLNSERSVIKNLDVVDFDKVNGHRCVVKATIDGQDLSLNGRVYSRETYEIQDDGTAKTIFHGWGVQGTNHLGVSVSLRYIGEK